MDLMVVITCITRCMTAQLGEKNHIPKKQENLDLRAKRNNELQALSGILSSCCPSSTGKR